MKYRKTGGFTLIELVVSMAIAAMLLLAVLSFSSLTVRINSTSMELGQAQNLAQMNLQAISGQLRFAKTLNIENTVPATLKDDYSYIYLNSGFIKKQTKGFTEDNLTPPAGFEGYTYSVSFVPVNAKVVGVNLAVIKDGKQLYSISEKIHVNNLVSESITGVSQGGCVSYQLSNESVRSITVTNSGGSIIDSNGEKVQFSALVYPQNASMKGVAWSVDKPSCASITQEGLLTPLSNGTVTVKATALDGSGVYGAKPIIISNQNVKITALNIYTSGGVNTVKDNYNTLQILADITPAYAYNQNLTWTVDDTSYATIDSSGLLTTKDKYGKTIMVTARTTDGSNLQDTIEIFIVD